MIDLETQLREYIDGIAEPIPSPATAVVTPEPAVERRPSRRRRGVILVAAVVVVSVAAALVAALLARSDSGPTRVEPVRGTGSAVPLTVQGTADCSAVRQPGDSLDLAVIVNGGRSICITTLGDRYAIFRNGLMSAGGGIPSSNSGGMGSTTIEGDRRLAFGSPVQDPKGVRMTFCDGSSIDVKPLSDNPPYWVGAEYDGSLGDLPAVQPLSDPKAPKPTEGTCPPPSTVGRGASKRAVDHGTAFTALGTADCASVQQPGDAVLLGVTVQGGHTICVTGQGNHAASFYDGRRVGETSNLTQAPLGTVPDASQVALDDGRSVVIATLLDRSDRLRYTFCDGLAVTLRALNDTTPRFAAGIVDFRDGFPSTLMLEGDRPAGFRRYTCPPPVTGKK